MPESTATMYSGKAQSLPAKRLMATPGKAKTGVRLSNTQNELLGMSKAPMAKPIEGISHNFIRAKAEEAYQVTDSNAISTAIGTFMPNVYCTALILSITLCMEAIVPKTSPATSKGHSHPYARPRLESAPLRATFHLLEMNLWIATDTSGSNTPTSSITNGRFHSVSKADKAKRSGKTSQF